MICIYTIIIIICLKTITRETRPNLHDSSHTKYECMHNQSLLLEINAVAVPRAPGIGKERWVFWNTEILWNTEMF